MKNEKNDIIVTNHSVEDDDHELGHGMDAVISTVMSPRGELIEVKLGDVDEAMDYVHDLEELTEWDDAYERKLLWKIDLFILPILGGIDVLSIDGQDHQLVCFHHGAQD
ncbi:unnamed protein product [Cyberlindnera jadinii]|uniref:Uncharacterized protein n=1 Tax=Cyberlindnera jadinii (strain ATCC 18201 / CBS 1600 / BCRC 20928 / JCM 3617 / NBRC 0987 / NRRL Y-1542) TaxID=983966 RepID=A0A0H5C1U2_CYBJN|nr:unnamed protein product [Cyberlindnera jadinii]